MTTAALKTLLDEARDATGLTDFGDTHFEATAAAWLSDLEHPRLNETGRTFLRRQMLKNMIKRLQIIDYWRCHPEILEVELPPIVLITGFARSGTTLLHNLMALHPAARTFKRWELLDSLPPPETATYASDPRIAKAQAAMEPLRDTALAGLHWVNANEPDECPWGYIDGSGILGVGACSAMPQWELWLRQRDARQTLREYRQLIQLLLWKNPVPEGGFLLLKSPMSTQGSQLAAYRETFADIRYVLTHRDPFRVAVSSANVGDTICQPFRTDRDDDYPRRVREQNQAWVCESARQIMALAEATDAHNLRYQDLMANPASRTAAALRGSGIELPSDFEDRVDSFLQAQRAGARPKAKASLDDFGYTHDAVWANPILSAYCARFQLSRETVRQTAPLEQAAQASVP